MKKIIMILLLNSTFIFAGYAGSQGTYIDIYDSNTGLYYKAISKESKGTGFIISSSSNRISNINIFDPKTDTSKMIFKSHNQKITDIIFEIKYKDNKIVFSDEYQHIKNNENIENRPLKDKLLIETYNNDKEEATLWSCSKNGDNLKKITVIPSKHSWHIDVKNSKIRVVFAQDGQFRLKSFKW